MQPVNRSETVLYLVIAAVTLFLAGIILIIVVARVQERSALQGTAVAAQQEATRLAEAQRPVPTATETRPGDWLPPSWTPVPSLTPTDTITPSPVPSLTPTATPTEPPTATPTVSPTPSPSNTPPRGAPTPVPLVVSDRYDLFNILLIGSDKRDTSPTFRTDTLIVVSINRTTNTVNMLSIPRDLYVFVPGFSFERVNTASYLGETYLGPGRGDALVAETITYNLGVRIDRHARVDFSGFRQVIDELGGVNVAVDCPLTDYRIVAPDRDPNDLANYAWYTLPIGMHRMDGSLALWYARSRQTTSDFERNRRQQIILRAVWRKVQEMGLVGQLPMLWEQLTGIVSTDLTLSDVLGLVPVALALDSSRIRSYLIGPAEVESYTTPGGAAVLQPVPDAVRRVVELFNTPPTNNLLFAERPLLEVYNGTDHADWGQVAVARLAWEGFAAVDGGSADPGSFPHTVIVDYTGGAKPGSLDVLMRALNVRRENIINAPDPNQPHDFRVILGESYNACTYSPWRAVVQN